MMSDQSIYQALFESLPVVVLTLDTSQHVLVCNRIAETTLGIPAAQLNGTHIGSLFESDSGKALVEMCQAGFEGDGESAVSLLDGRTLGFSITRVDAERVLLLLRETSTMQLLQAEISNTRRMASVGQLAGGIAHEVNNPLAVIQGRIEMLRAVPEMSADMRARHLDVLEEHCLRVARIVQNLHSFARPRTPDCKWTTVAYIFEIALERLGRRVERVSIEQTVPRGLKVFGDEQQLCQVMVNLINLSIDLSPDGGVVELRAVDVGGGTVRLEVLDEGHGLDDELLYELRAPYAAGSTPIDAGRGLALAVSWGMVQDHGGWLTAEARRPRGTWLQLQFPGALASGVHSPGHASVANCTILVVDDDRIMCETIGWMLTTEGHQVVKVHSAEQALDILQHQDFDYLVTDMRLPGMSGEDLIAVLRDSHPELAGRTILTSGLLYRPQDPERYLQKPFTQKQLLKTLFQGR
jgi:signal transduction histidine kinase